MSHEKPTESAHRTQNVTESTLARHRGKIAIGTVVLAAGVAGAGLALNRNEGGEAADSTYDNVETAGPALANDILDLYMNDPKIMPSAPEAAGDDGSEIIKGRYQVPGPTKAAGYSVDSTEYSLYIQVPNAEEALKDGEVTADEITSVNVQAAHVHGYDYAPAPFAYSATLSNENGTWIIDASGMDNGAEWRVYGTPEAAALQQMHQVVEKAEAGDPLPGMPRPE